MTRTLTDLLPDPITFTVYRYRHLYVVQRDHLLVLTPQGSVVTHPLGFAPESFHSYGGLVSFTGFRGAAQLSGPDLVLHEALPSSEAPATYTAPLAEPIKNGVPLTPHALWSGEDLHGLPLTYRGRVSHAPLLDRSFYEPLLGATLEPHHYLVFQRTRAQFGLLNGVPGELLYAEPDALPQTLVAYSYPQLNLHGAGYQGGFLFSPDFGRSYRTRKLDGFGVLTERGILACSPEGGVQLVTGVFP